MTTSTRGSAPAFLPVTHAVRRTHDGSVISYHCGLSCGQAAMERLSLAQMMGGTPPGPLEQVQAQLVDLVTDEVLGFVGGLIPLDGAAPPEVLSWP